MTRAWVLVASLALAGCSGGPYRCACGRTSGGIVVQGAGPFEDYLDDKTARGRRLTAACTTFCDEVRQ